VGVARRGAGVSGLGAVTVLFAAVIAVGSVGEPPLDASSQEAATFFRDAGAGWVQAAEAAASLGMLAFVWFVIGWPCCCDAPRATRPGGPPSPWRPVSWWRRTACWTPAGTRRLTVALTWTPAIAAYAFDVGNLGFANAWLAMASFAVSCGWVTLSTGVLPRWTGWCATASGIGLVVARFLWYVEAVWLPPYAVFWLWVVVTCVQLVRHPHEISRLRSNT